jgi:hypothetical protein
MPASLKHLGSFLAGWYAWLLALSFGMVLLDIQYAQYSRLAPEAARAFSDAADFLLLVNFVTLLSAIAAIAFSWNSQTARNLFIASLLVMLFEFLIPALVSPFIKNTQRLAIGPWLRIIPTGAASLLAFIGLYKFIQQT